jgi:hypothetical protein
VQGSQADIEARVAVLEEQLRQSLRDRAEIRELLSGPPWERSVRGRLHAVEAEGRAAALATATLAEVRLERRRFHEERRKARRLTVSLRWKLLGAVTAAFVAAAPYVQMYYGAGR